MQKVAGSNLSMLSFLKFVSSLLPLQINKKFGLRNQVITLKSRNVFLPGAVAVLRSQRDLAASLDLSFRCHTPSVNRNPGVSQGLHLLRRNGTL